MKKLDKWVSCYRDRHGKLRYRFRRKGKQVLLPPPDHPEYEAAYEAARAEIKGPISGKRAKPGTLGALIIEYYSSPEFLDLAAQTKRTYRSVLEPLREAHADKRVAALKPNHVRAMLAAKVDKPGASNKLLRHLRTLMKFGIANGYRRNDPTAGIRKRKIRDGGFKDWNEGLIKTFRAYWPSGSKPRLALELLLCTAQRRGDVVQLGRQHLNDNEIHLRQEKTGTKLWIPVHHDLRRELDTLPETQMLFLQTEYGKSFSAAGFGNWFRDKCERAGIPKGYSAHGLRKSACRRLAEAGCTAPQIMAVSGHRSMKEVQLYIDAADQRKLAAQAMKRTENKNG